MQELLTSLTWSFPVLFIFLLRCSIVEHSEKFPGTLYEHLTKWNTIAAPVYTQNLLLIIYSLLTFYLMNIKKNRWRNWELKIFTHAVTGEDCRIQAKSRILIQTFSPGYTYEMGLYITSFYIIPLQKITLFLYCFVQEFLLYLWSVWISFLQGANVSKLFTLYLWPKDMTSPCTQTLFECSPRVLTGSESQGRNNEKILSIRKTFSKIP